MKRNIKLFVGAVALGLIAFASCKKSSSAPSSPIDGKWKLVEDAIDGNSNDTLDASEIFADSTNSYETFNAGGSGTWSATGLGSAAFKWQFVDSNKWLKQTYNGSGQVTYYRVDKLTTDTLILLDTTVFYYWYIYTK